MESGAGNQVDKWRERLEKMWFQGFLYKDATSEYLTFFKQSLCNSCNLETKCLHIMLTIDTDTLYFAYEIVICQGDVITNFSPLSLTELVMKEPVYEQ